MLGTTFKAAYLAGRCNIEDINDWMQEWYLRGPTGTSLRSYLGLTTTEYNMWKLHGNQSLSKLLDKYKGGE